MSKERCQATKQLMKQALTIMQSGACGSGRGVSLASTYLEDAYLRVDFHMREQGWNDITPEPLVQAAMLPPNSIMPNPAMPRVNTLTPAAHIPQLKTGLMNAPKAMADDTKPRRGRPPQQDTSDMDLL